MKNTLDTPLIPAFRPAIALRVTSLAIGIPMTALLILAIFEQSTTSDVLAGMVIACILWAIFSWLPFAAKVVLFTDRIVLINPWGTQIIPLNEIDEVRGGRFLTVRTRDGAERTAWAVQGSSAVALQGQPSRADRVASQIWETIGGLAVQDGTASGVSWRWTSPPWIFVVGELVVVILGIAAYQQIG